MNWQDVISLIAIPIVFYIVYLKYKSQRKEENRDVYEE